MCGIAGGLFWNRRHDAQAAEAAVTSMLGVLRHRGPDDSGLFRTSTDEGDSSPFVVLGHTRLAILDLSAAGRQPMLGDRGSAITFNGEIYNFIELRTELERAGARFESRTDTEVLLRGFDVWGLGVLNRLRGMFAFALWDSANRRLVLARDRMGIKPLYFYRGDGFLLFASEVRALLASNLVPRTLDPTALWQYLGYQSIPAPRTLVKGVRMLDAGSWMLAGPGGTTRAEPYWNMLASSHGPSSYVASGFSRTAESKHQLADVLRDAVRSHLVSDVPVGAFLSGGIDSSAVVALIREAGHTPRTFSVGFHEQQFDESVHARLVAQTFNTAHTHIKLRDDDLLDQLPRALDAMDQPTGDGVNTFVISEAVRRQGISVALSGLGGDEVFGGYPSFSRLARIADVTSLWGRSPAGVRTLAAAAVRALGGDSIAVSKAAAVLETDGSLAAMFPLTRQVLSAEQRLDLLSPRLVDEVEDLHDPYDRFLSQAFEEASDASVFARVAFAESRTYMHDVLLRDTDQMSMAHSLEVRVPLLDHTVVEHAMEVPDAQKWANGVPKRLLVESLGGLLPPEIVHRPKQGFTLPFEPWMRSSLRPFCEAHLGERGLAGRGLFDRSAIKGRWASFLNGGKDVSWSRLWILVVLDAWLGRHGVQHDC